MVWYVSILIEILRKLIDKLLYQFNEQMNICIFENLIRSKHKAKVILKTLTFYDFFLQIKSSRYSVQ